MSTFLQLLGLQPGEVDALLEKIRAVLKEELKKVAREIIDEILKEN